MTVAGDTAQRGAAWGVRSWADALEPHAPGAWRVEELTVNYRTPVEIIEVAADVLAAISPELRPPRSVRETGVAPWALRLDEAELGARLPEVVAGEASTIEGGKLAVLVPAERAEELGRRVAAVPGAAAERGPAALDARIAVLTVAESKGLEFDSVVLVDPAGIVAESPRGIADLYVALTRATQRLGVVHRDGHGLLRQIGGVGPRERLEGQRAGVAHARPQLLGDVGGQRCQHQHQRLGDHSRRAVGIRRGQVAAQLGDPGDGGVEAQRLDTRPHGGHGAVQHAQRLRRRRPAGHPGGAGPLVDEVAPDALQQAVRADDRPGLPRPRLVERTAEHQVEAEGVGPVAGVQLVGADRVLQALAHLAVLAPDRLAAPAEAAVRLGDLGGRHVDATPVRERVRLHVALVDQAVERLGGAHLAQVVQHLLPEARVQQVQDRLLDPADVQVDAARVAGPARAHPVALVGRVDEPVVVVRIDVAQLVPAGARPLRHDVQLAAVAPGPLAQVQGDLGPAGGARQRWLWRAGGVVGVERRREVAQVEVRQLQRQHRLGQGDRQAVLVVDDRERLAPVALAREQPVA